MLDIKLVLVIKLDLYIKQHVMNISPKTIFMIAILVYIIILFCLFIHSFTLIK